MSRAAADAQGGSFTAADGEQYAVLYNDYITVYVRASDGGFAVLPATEHFDGSKPLSYAAFEIDGEAYRYGTYYSGMSGTVSIAPQVNENNVLEARWQIGDFVIAQVFAITEDVAHTNSYAVKIGYAAQYFGEDTAQIAGRILLDTQFTPEESVPLMLMDSEDNFVLVESEAIVSPVPTVALISADFIAEANAAAEEDSDLPIYADMPNKGYLIFDDAAFVSPDGLMLADFAAAHGADFAYAPAGGGMLFDGSGADSAALLHWDSVPATQGGQMSFGTNYGFYDMVRGNQRFDAVQEPMSISALSATAPIEFFADCDSAPAEHFFLTSNVMISEEYYAHVYRGTPVPGQDLVFQLDYTADVSPIVSNIIKSYRAIVAEGTAYEVNLGPVDIGSPVTISAAQIDAISAALEAEAELGGGVVEGIFIFFEPIWELSADYTSVSIGVHDTSYRGETSIALTGEGVVAFDALSHGGIYFVDTAYTPTLNVELSDMDYTLESVVVEPSVPYGSSAPTLEADLPMSGGPLSYSGALPIASYNAAAQGYVVTANVVHDSSSRPYPISVKAYHASADPGSPLIAEIEVALWNAAGGTEFFREQGLLWARAGTEVTLDTAIMSTYGGSLNVYWAGTKNPYYGFNPGDSSFTMPGEALDLVYENGTVHRVTTEVLLEGGGNGSMLATMTVNSATGTSATPKYSETVNVYVSNLANHYQVASISTDVADVTFTPQPGGSWQFTMPSSDVHITATLALVSDDRPIHKLYVNPLVGADRVLYDVSFWTDDYDGERLPYQVDDAGLSGRVREGATVYYHIYPTSWDTTPGSAHNMDQWVVDSFTNNGVPVVGFEGINTAARSGISHFPYDYSSNNPQATAGTFIMPAEDVTLELSGYREDYTYSLSLEAYDVDGVRLPWVEKMIRSAPAQNGVPEPIILSFQNWIYSMEGIGQFGINKQTALFTYDSIHGYVLKSADMVVDYGNGQNNIIPLSIVTADNTSTLIVEPTWPYSATIRLTYQSDVRKLAIKGFELDADAYIRYGEVLVAEGDSYNMAGGDTRSIAVAPMDGSYETLLTLTWTEVFGTDAYGAYYYLDNAYATGCTVTLLREGSDGGRGRYAVYQVTNITDAAEITIQQDPAARDIDFSDYFLPDSPNSTTFGSVTMASGAPINGLFEVNIQDVLEASTAPKITKITLASDAGYTADVSASNVFTDGRYADAFAFSDDRIYMTLDVRKLLGIADGYQLPTGSYTLTIDYTYGKNDGSLGSRDYSFDLSSESFSPGDLTHIAITTALNVRGGGWRQGVYPGDWVAVPGSSYENMIENVAIYNTSGHLLYFVCEKGFEADTGVYTMAPYSGYHQFLAKDADVLVNGVGTLKPFLGGNAFMINEDTGNGGGITIISDGMSLHSTFLPLFVPVRVGGYTATALEMRLDKEEDYTIRDAMPDYDAYRDMYATNEQAEEKWCEAVEAAKDSMLAFKVVYPASVYSGANGFLGADLGGRGLEATIGGFTGGVTVDISEIYLMSSGFECGGRLNMQIPGSSKPILRLELLSLSTRTGSSKFPIANVWAEGAGMLQLPSALGGYGGSAEGVFNTYTGKYGFEGEINFHFIELEGSFYIARLANGWPMLDTFIVSFGVNDLPVGIGLPPAPAQIIELEGITMGVTKLADTLSYNPIKNTIPSVRIILGAQFSLVEIISFGAEMWSELLSGGISVNAGIAIGPLNLPIFKELAFEFGAYDGPYIAADENPDSAVYFRGKSSILFFVNARFHASLLFADGSGAFGITVKISPKFWEKKGGFASLDEVKEFLDLGLTAWGRMKLGILQISDDWSIFDAEIRIDIVIGAGTNFEYMPFAFKTFEFIGEEHFFGVKTSESRLNLLAYYVALDRWVAEKLEKVKEKAENLRGSSLSITEVAQLQMTLMNEAMASPEAHGISVNPNYQPEYRNFLTDVVASSESQPAPAGRGARAMFGATSVPDAVRVETANGVYTHHVNVPDDGSRYILRLSGYGERALTLDDINAFKPNGQALALSSADGGATAALANAAYNAVIKDGEMLLSLADYNNTTGGIADVTGVVGTLPGLWQIKSSQIFQSDLIRMSNPGMASVELKSNGELNVAFENIGNGSDDGYYYDLALERKGDPSAAPEETATLLKNMPVPAGGTVTLDMASMPNQSDLTDSTLKYDISDYLASGNWYARITLRQGGMEDFSTTDETGAPQTLSMLITKYVSDGLSMMPYALTATALGESWTPNLSAASGGNQSIDVSFDSATPPSGMAVTGYHVIIYEESGKMPAVNMMSKSDENGGSVQNPTPMQFTIPVDETMTTNSYNIPNVPIGKYMVGVTALYAKKLSTTGNPAEENTISPAVRRGTEERSGVVTIAQAFPPTISLSVTGGNLSELNGANVVFAGPNATLSATSSSGTVAFFLPDGTLVPATNGTVDDLLAYNGQQIMIVAKNANDDATVQYLNVYATSAPMLLPDNYDKTAGAFLFTAYQDTGKFEITGQTEPGALIGGTGAGADGRFEVVGNLASGVDSDTVTLAVANEAGMVTMREVEITRSTQNEPPPPSSGGSSGAVQTIPAANGTVQVAFTQSGGDVTLQLPSAKLTEIIGKSNGTAVFDLSKIPNATAVIFPKAALEALAEAKLGVEARLPQGTVTLDAQAVASVAAQAQGDTVSIGLKQIPAASLSAAQRSAINPGDMVLDITIRSGSQNMMQFDGALHISIPYNGQLPADVWSLSSAGVLEKLESTYHTATKTVSFRLTHLPLYVVGYDGIAWANPFSDVRETDWFYSAVEFAHQNGLFSGTSATAFAPNDTMTRGMLATVLWRLAGSPTAGHAAFTDVPGGAWYSEAVSWAHASGIVAGVGGNLFAPDDDITREQMAVMLYNYAKYVDAALPKNRTGTCADEAQISDWAKEAVAAMYAAEILNGKGANTFDPQGRASRAEVATMFMRFVMTTT